MNSLIYSRILDWRYNVVPENRDDEYVLIDGLNGHVAGLEDYRNDEFLLYFKDNSNKWEMYSHDGLDYEYEDGECDEVLHVLEFGEVILVRGKLEGQTFNKLEIEHAKEELYGFFDDLFPFGSRIDIDEDLLTVFDECDGILIEFDIYNMQLVDYREEHCYDGPVYFHLEKR